MARFESSELALKPAASNHVSLLVNGGSQVVLLVRHPIKAIWSEFQRRQNIEVGSRGGGGHVAAVKALTSAEKASFRSWSKCMSCRWLQYVTAHLQLAQVLPLQLLLFERLVSDPVAAIREVRI